MVQDAQVEKDMMLASAREATAAQVAELELETAQARQKLALAQQELAAFVKHSQELCAAQAAFLAQLPEMELAEKEEETKRAEQNLSLIKEMLNQYQDPGDRLDKMVELQIQVNKLLEENATLKQKLQQAYEFMKSKFLNGVNMFEEFARSIGAKVQERWEDRNKGAR